jgi:cysteine desulfurase
MSPAPIYLDYAAATPLDDAAFVAMKPFFAENFYNPSAVYQAARDVHAELEGARASVADVLGAKDQEIIFTAGGTEANNLAIHGIMQQFPNGNIVVSSIEHESVLAPAKQYDCRVAPVNKKGAVDLQELEQLIDENTVLVSIMYANNEVGTVQPIKEIAALIAKKRTERPSPLSPQHSPPLLFHTDACQAANYLDLHVTRLHVDMMTLNGGKIYAPKQSGCLYVKAGTPLNAQIQGGGQESGLRSGTENTPAILGFATMLQKVQNERKSEGERLSVIKNEIIAKLSQKIPTMQLNGDSRRSLPNNINVTIPGIDGERFVMELDERGIQVATGSACSASNDEPSHVLLALGLSESSAGASLRLTLGRHTKPEHISIVVQQITDVLKTHQGLLV